MIYRKPLPNVPFHPRIYQMDARNWGLDKVKSEPGKWHLTVSPTGTGKSIWELLWLQAIPDSVLITPRLEIIAGLIDKLGIYVDHSQLVATAQEWGIFTPIRFRNILAKGELAYMPSVCILDECHHAEADSWQDIDMYLNKCTVLGATASPFRGTPQGTAAFRKRWHNVKHVLKLSEAVANRYCAFPTSTMWPLIDDDLVDISNGELKVSTCSSMVADNIAHIVERSKALYCSRGRIWTKPTMYSVPTRDTAYLLADALTKSNMPAKAVTQETTRTDREKLFDKVIHQFTALVQIDVISEGVDLPIRRMVDLRPTMSPVKWLQQIGRIMRPADDPPEYICACRNLERHGYLMEGMFPNDAIREAQEAFTDAEGNPRYTKRAGTRSLGLEGLGKFVTTPIHLLNGLTAFLYNLVHVDGYKRTEYMVLTLPNQVEVLYAQRVSTRKPGVTEGPPQYTWGRWQAISGLPDLKGCHSANPGQLTSGQSDWWMGWGKHAGRGAEAYGLNPHKEVNNRSFQVLPLLKDLGARL